MSEIKYTIGVLCKLLNLLFHDVNLSVEHFRMAKENKNNKILMETLGKLLRNLKYEKIDFGDFSKSLKFGSRKMLFLITFIIAKPSLDQLFFDKLKTSPFDENYDFLKVENRKHGNIFNLVNEEERNYDLMLWIKGKLEQNLMQIQEYKKQNKTIIKKLHVNSSDNSDNLSVNKILALSNKFLCKQFMEETNELMDTLENLLIWKRKEHVFWKWMKEIL
ncbi:uncharacterized protein LOC126265506 isoform X1 [Aethina tumida]|uniref:uncharacterized protein LOC126265506 isoform X1 n=1 Tax=Aethina tumida TaxID=116153 RepID=UPI00214834AF|nr:uncharacterized protein LOC126265506 isoform X1 [Aethina tumida]